MYDSAGYRAAVALMLAAAMSSLGGCGDVSEAEATTAATPTTPAPSRSLSDDDPWPDDFLDNLDQSIADLEAALVEPIPPSAMTPAPVVAPAPPQGAAGHVMDLTDVDVPLGPVTGRVGPGTFSTSKVQYTPSTGVITFESDDHQTVFVFLFAEGGVAGREFSIETPSSGFDQPHIHMHFPVGGNDRDIAMFMEGYVLDLSFGPERDGRIAGHIYLCVPDEHESWIAGRFSVDTRK